MENTRRISSRREQSCELLGNSLADSASEAFGSIRVPPRLPHVCTTSRLDTCQHLPAADILQMFDGCVNRCRESLDLILCSACLTGLEPTVLLLLTTLLIPHLLLPCHPFYSLTLVQYIAYMLFFSPLISSTESPQVLLAVSFACLKENRAQRSIGHTNTCRFSRWREEEPWQ